MSIISQESLSISRRSLILGSAAVFVSAISSTLPAEAFALQKPDSGAFEMSFYSSDYSETVFVNGDQYQFSYDLSDEGNRLIIIENKTQATKTLLEYDEDSETIYRDDRTFASVGTLSTMAW